MDTKTRNIKIIANTVAGHVSTMSNENNIRDFMARMESMVEMMELDVHEYREAIDKRLPQMRMPV